MLHVILSFWATVTVLFVNMDTSKVRKKRLKVVVVRSKNKIQYLLPDRNCVWLEILFALYATHTKRNVDNNQYKEGELARCSLEPTAEKLLQKKKFYLKNENNRLYAASKRLDIKLSGSFHDIYTVNIFYRQSCYVKYVHSRSSAILDSEINYVENIRKTALDIFLQM